jgi:hypothetical protein
MHEEIETRRYYLEMEDAMVASVCILLNEVSGYTAPEQPDFTIIIGLKEETSSAATKAAALTTLMQPASPATHGAAIGKGMAVITLSYRCTSQHNTLCPLAARKAPPSFILGLLVAEKYLPMAHYHRCMAHIQAMEEMRWSLGTGQAMAASSATVWN